MKKYQMFCCLASIFFVILLWGIGNSLSVFPSRYAPGIGIYSKNPVFSFSAANQAIENGGGAEEQMPKDFTLWSFSEGVVWTQWNGKEAKADVIQANGAISNIERMWFLDGSGIFRGEKDGCVISRELAYQLFGGVWAGGKVRYDGRDYIVRGVCDTSGQVIYIQGQEDAAQYDRMELIYPEGADAIRLAKQFLYQIGFEDEEVFVNGRAIGEAAAGAALLPEVLLSAALLFGIFKQVWRARNTVLLFCGWLAVFAISFFCVKLFSGIHFTIPDSLIPSRWSDFSFWGKRWLEFSEAVSSYLAFPPAGRDIALRLSLEAEAFVILAALAAVCIFICMSKGLSSIGFYVCLAAAFLLPQAGRLLWNAFYAGSRYQYLLCSFLLLQRMLESWEWAIEGRTAEEEKQYDGNFVPGCDEAVSGEHPGSRPVSDGNTK